MRQIHTALYISASFVQHSSFPRLCLRFHSKNRYNWFSPSHLKYIFNLKRQAKFIFTNSCEKDIKIFTESVKSLFSLSLQKSLPSVVVIGIRTVSETFSVTVRDDRLLVSAQIPDRVLFNLCSGVHVLKSGVLTVCDGYSSHKDQIQDG